MGDENVRGEVVKHLNQSLDADELSEKDFHIRQALQLLETDESS